MCRGGGGDLLYLLCLISNTLPQLEHFLAAINSSPSSPPSTDHQLQPSPSTPPPPHLQKRKKTSNNRLGTPLSRGVEKTEGPSALQPTTESQ